jgi:ATP-binding cassette subfamily B protein/subfamily B ATP-binding cassette protein MsbA
MRADSTRILLQWRRLARLLSYTFPDRWRWLAIAVVTVGASAATVLQPLPMKVLVDNVLARQPLDESWGQLVYKLPGTHSAPGLVAWIAVTTLVLFALGSALEVVLTLHWTRVGQRMVYALSADLFARLQRRSLIFHTRNSVGDQVARITGDCWCVHSVADALLFAPLHAALTLIGMLVLMWAMSPALTVWSVVLAPLMAVSSVLLGRRLRSAAHEQRRAESDIHSMLQQTLAGIPVVQAFAQEGREHARFRGYADSALRAAGRATVMATWADLASGLVIIVGRALVLWVGARQVLQGSLSLGSLLVFLAYLQTFQTQLKVFGDIPIALQEAGAGIDRVGEVLESDPDVRDRPDATPKIERARGHVRFEGVTFGYEPGRPPALRGVTFEALPGQTVAIVGPTGVGKTTLAGLIARFFDPWEGRVTLDGWDLRDVTLATLRPQVALVPQEPFLFPVTVAENVAYGRPDATRDQIEAATRAANADEFVSQLAEGYDTILGERGATLSGGQRQRLSIARALLTDAPVLILDEPTSALDAGTEGLILEAMDRLTENRTTFIIAHRFSTIRRADRIVVVDQGQIVECGTHEQLLANGRLYSRLCELQSGDREEPDRIAPTSLERPGLLV